MKNSIKTMFVVLAIVMTFVVVQADRSEATDCGLSVVGIVTAVNYSDNSVMVNNTIIDGIPDGLLVVGDTVRITYLLTTCDYLACTVYVIVDGSEILIYTRADTPDDPSQDPEDPTPNEDPAQTNQYNNK